MVELTKNVIRSGSHNVVYLIYKINKKDLLLNQTSTISCLIYKVKKNGFIQKNT